MGQEGSVLHVEVPKGIFGGPSNYTCLPGVRRLSDKQQSFEL
jgi:hypothetical protein